ncbi:uncharacterized protein LOC133518313 [Cydia pomonella]|uniref:uncharacterized protein LOC133518313 n=1 Tax=Cydia pomonella TaxID=82600 RepID=UPI002ADE4C49|nr:uncharacterized protein LOC133518313 [Cydia pomonella]
MPDYSQLYVQDMHNKLITINKNYISRLLRRTDGLKRIIRAIPAAAATMSPVARSLLALAALLATADAVCTSNVHGNDTDHVELLGPFEVSSSDAENGKVITIEDTCGFGKPVGVTINACNSHSSRTFSDGEPPRLSSNMSRAEVRCEPRACPSGIHVQVIQYCDSGNYVPRP